MKILFEPDANGVTGGAPGMPAVVTSALPPAGTQISHPEPAANPSPESPNDSSNDAPPNPITQAQVEGDADGIKFSDFESAMGKTFTNEPAKPKTEEPAKDNPPSAATEDKTNKEPEKKEDITKKDDALPPLSITPIAKKPSQMSQRDFTDIAAEDQELFKKMSQDAFDKLKPVYVQHKKSSEIIKQKDQEIQQLKVSAPPGLPPSYLEHEQSYVLTPEYSEAVQTTQLIRGEFAHWTEQLRKVKAGEPWENLTGYDNNGNLIKSAALKSSPDAEEYLRGKMLEAQQLYKQTEQSVAVMAQTHKQKVQQAHLMLKQAEDKYFPFYKNLPDDAPDKAIIEKVIKSLPEAYRNNPMSMLVAKAYAVCIRMQNQITELSEGKVVNTQASIQEDVKKAGPTQGKLGAAPAADKQEDANILGKFESLVGKKIG